MRSHVAVDVILLPNPNSIIMYLTVLVSYILYKTEHTKKGLKVNMYVGVANGRQRISNSVSEKDKFKVSKL